MLSIGSAALGLGAGAKNFSRIRSCNSPRTSSNWASTSAASSPATSSDASILMIFFSSNSSTMLSVSTVTKMKSAENFSCRKW